MSEPVETRVTLRIPRGSQQDLQEEARERLARVDVVEDVERFDVVGVRPGLNDLRVRVRATLAYEEQVDRDLDRSLSAAVGIERVELIDSEPER